MVATIKSLEITECPNLDPRHFDPEDREDFICTFGLMVGPRGSEGGDFFYVTVCSPMRLEKLCERDGFVWGRHHLIVRYFDLEMIRSILIKFVNNCSGESWEEIGPKLARLGAWEFEDYQQSGPALP